LNRLKELHAGKKLVFTNGCFDLLHSGHIEVLKFCKQRGDIVIVGLNSDSSVKRLKGPARPINNQQVRTDLLSSISYVDYVVVFEEDTPLQLLKDLKPYYFVKGGDYKVESLEGREYATETLICNFVEGLSTSNTVNRILSDGVRFPSEFESTIKKMLPVNDKSRRIIVIEGSSSVVNVIAEKYLSLSREKAEFLLKRYGVVINNETPLTTMLQFLTHQKLWESTLLETDVDLLEVCEGDLNKSLNRKTNSCVILSKNPLHYVISTKCLPTLLYQSSPDVILILESIPQEKKETQTTDQSAPHVALSAF
jgi:rfaE bifunctional protein nucleotidyltransferase chain/domain